ncbi:hypothetical protein [uncultured Brevundimonas sp.]|uniref:hypothetical protein n=1 Tax=uncultured Brevundimonas sp. TaxID=213418 RepID=UPI002629C4AA|nr:hypothetical protein [uncultured Brevundimonas sp.]
MTADLSALIARLEAAEAGSRELDAAIPRALGWDVHNARRNGLWVVPFGEYDTCDPDDMFELGEFTTSLDAALALAERVLPGWAWMVRHWPEDQGNGIAGWTAYVRATDCELVGSGPVFSTPALALVIATLRAKLYGYAAEGEVNKNPKAQEG